MIHTVHVQCNTARATCAPAQYVSIWNIILGGSVAHLQSWVYTYIRLNRLMVHTMLLKRFPTKLFEAPLRWNSVDIANVRIGYWMCWSLIRLPDNAFAEKILTENILCNEMSIICFGKEIFLRYLLMLECRYKIILICNGTDDTDGDHIMFVVFHCNL